MPESEVLSIFLKYAKDAFSDKQHHVIVFSTDDTWYFWQTPLHCVEMHDSFIREHLVPMACVLLILIASSQSL